MTRTIGRARRRLGVPNQAPTGSAEPRAFPQLEAKDFDGESDNDDGDMEAEE